MAILSKLAKVIVPFNFLILLEVFGFKLIFYDISCPKFYRDMRQCLKFVVEAKKIVLQSNEDI
jgi:hypothetical protein